MFLRHILQQDISSAQILPKESQITQYLKTLLHQDHVGAKSMKIPTDFSCTRGEAYVHAHYIKPPFSSSDHEHICCLVLIVASTIIFAESISPFTIYLAHIYLLRKEDMKPHNIQNILSSSKSIQLMKGSHFHHPETHWKPLQTASQAANNS
uniref:Uncharacterized protein n=1 Tax=Arundo donax TaxID=35708 RepID=A0A0A8Y257_ARUDO